MDANWGLISYVMIGLMFLSLILMVIVSIKAIRFFMLIGLIIFGSCAYLSYGKKIEQENAIINTKNLENGASKILEGAKEIGSEIGNSIKKQIEPESKTEKVLKDVNKKVDSSVEQLDKAADDIAEKSVDWLKNFTEDSKDVIKDKKEEFKDKVLN